MDDRRGTRGHKLKLCNVKDSSANRLFRCNGCRARFYCSQECQSADWHHRTVCKLTGNAGISDEEVALSEKISVFATAFERQITVICWKLLNGGRDNWLGDSFYVDVSLVDLPRGYYQSPRLELEDIRVVPLYDLNEDVCKQSLCALRKAHPDHLMVLLRFRYPGCFLHRYKSFDKEYHLSRHLDKRAITENDPNPSGSLRRYAIEFKESLNATIRQQTKKSTSRSSDR